MQIPGIVRNIEQILGISKRANSWKTFNKEKKNSEQ